MLTTPPLPHFVVPTSVVVCIGWRRTVRCSVDHQRTHWDGADVEHEKVRSVAYGTQTRTINLVDRHLRRRIQIETKGTSLNIDLGRRLFGPKDASVHQSAFAAVVAALHGIVEPRLRAEYLRTIAAGSTVRIGPLWLALDGMRHEAEPHCKPRRWEQVPTALLDAHQVIVESAIGSRRETPWTLSAMIPNAVLLPELLAEAAAAFS